MQLVCFPVLTLPRKACILGVLGGLWILGSVSARASEVSVYFAGSHSVGIQPGAEFLKEIAELPSTSPLMDQLGETWIQWLKPSGTLDEKGKHFLKDLFRDALTFPSVWNRDARGEWSCSFKMSGKRIAYWLDMASRLPLPKPRQEGDWLSFGMNSAAKSQKSWLDSLTESTQDRTAAVFGVKWIAGPDEKVGLPGLPKSLKQIGLESRLKDGWMRTEGKIQFASDLPIQLEPWKVPSKTIHDPVVSLLALRGIQDWADGLDVRRILGIQNPVHQAFVWSMPAMGFHLFGALRAPGAAGQMDAIEKAIRSWIPTNFPPNAPFQLKRMDGDGGLRWQGLPIVEPYLKAAPEVEKDTLIMGLFPLQPSGKPLPASLLEALNASDDLVAYHWEITQHRLIHWAQLNQLMGFITGAPSLSSQPIMVRWIQEVSPKLGNCITMLHLEDAQTLRLERKSHLGLNGLELVALFHWLSSDRFPQWPSWMPRHSHPVPGLPVAPSKP